MKLTDKTLALLVEGDPAEVEVLHFVRSPPISQVGHSSFYRCHRLVSLSLARLGLRTIDGDALAACATLWWIDLSRNRLETLAGSGLDAFAALGLLDVSGNAVAIDAIASGGSIAARFTGQSISPIPARWTLTSSGAYGALWAFLTVNTIAPIASILTGCSRGSCGATRAFTSF